MRNGFTKIPNSLCDMPLSMEALALYTWLSLRADEKGNVAMSLNNLVELTGLSKKQVRNALEKLISLQLVVRLGAQEWAQKGAQLRAQHSSILTICYLSSYESQKREKGTVKGTTKGTVKGTASRVYKNDNYNIMSINKTKEEENIISPDVEIISHTQNACEAFQEWLKKECPYIASHYKQMTEVEFEKLKEEYGSKAIAEQCLNIENRIDLRKRYSNLYRTLINWLKKNNYETTRINRCQQDYPTNDELKRQTIEFLASREAQRRACDK